MLQYGFSFDANFLFTEENLRIPDLLTLLCLYLFWDETQPKLCDLNLPCLISHFVSSMEARFNEDTHTCMYLQTLILYSHNKIVQCILLVCLFLTLHLHYLQKDTMKSTEMVTVTEKGCHGINAAAEYRGESYSLWSVKLLTRTRE